MLDAVHCHAADHVHVQERHASWQLLGTYRWVTHDTTHTVPHEHLISRVPVEVEMRVERDTDQPRCMRALTNVLMP